MPKGDDAKETLVRPLKTWYTWNVGKAWFPLAVVWETNQTGMLPVSIGRETISSLPRRLNYGVVLSTRKELRESKDIIAETLTGDLLFDVSTPLGFRVRVSRAYWELITTMKHPAMAGRENDVQEIKVYYDQVGNTLTVWFGEPQEEYVAEETGDEVVLMKNRSGQVIGFEKLNFIASKPAHLQVAFETVAT